ncbi:sulfur metabolism negative regulator [Blastocystis sp. subtype 4]|uniref:sulfur metabolism negative regulator n=1 Tax=Blastocystis sp. subtype 4 TaxID=944170 RepID=UPI0007122C44|nr:sulfur metabolism negative regulator [Blastocystis sp. subtype 4]KNB43293.1 sulfur metabolism negative regulator [Blastocystis sp. subtype 4]|eukprot:XP_014526741.1 sulfur metabolism negative regulator [Blastocystis sp. subtype 4]
MENGDKYVLISMEGGRHIIEPKVLEMSEYLKGLKEKGSISNNTVTLENVKETSLNRVVEFCTYHLDKPFTEIDRPLKSSNMRDVVSEWDANFVNITTEELLDLIVVANFLIIQPLLDLTCAKVASIIKGKSPEEIRAAFGIVNDFTSEEEAKVGF